MTTIADILHEAADHWLTTDPDDWNNRIESEKYSCCAVDAAASHLIPNWNVNYRMVDRIFEGFRAMGLDTSSGTAFVELGYPKGAHADTQAARYMWLKFAALIAEEQDI